jgi:hypothetical protein
MQLEVAAGPTVVKQDGTSTPLSAVQSVLELVAGHDSCTSTRSADSVVTTADATNCVLTASSDNGASAGSCAVASGSSSTHSCAYVAGTWAAVSMVRPGLSRATRGSPGRKRYSSAAPCAIAPARAPRD